jgi:hypothetical protein
MSIYPVFSIESIKAWCEKDVAGFIAQEKLKSSLNLETGFTLNKYLYKFKPTNTYPHA